MASFRDLAAVTPTTSGRAALYHALRQLDLPTGSRVLVPTYHCPTMIAPVFQAGLEPRFFGLRPDGLPNLDALAGSALDGVKAMFVAHYFGLPRSLREVRAWCDARQIALIEDCAHCFFGHAGELPVGAWGDFATASITKFLPVPEGGLLGSNRRSLRDIELRALPLRRQIKGLVDVLEYSTIHRRLRGMGDLLSPFFRLKNSLRNKTASSTQARADTPLDLAFADCDMDRTGDAPLRVSTWLAEVLPHAGMISRRQRNYALYHQALAHVAGAHPLFTTWDSGNAPYVFPLWVDDADGLFPILRAEGLAVLRWDRLWPGTSELPGDVGLQWSRHVLQFLCHQDLRPADIAKTVATTMSVLAKSQRFDRSDYET